jgi:cysteinyl-tRNA synthetase
VNGDVYYRTRKFLPYGNLSGQNIDDLEAGARIEVGDVKEDPLDFALWKARKEESEIAWESPLGLGRPGWHIECSVMSTKYLGDTIDIHAGGEDLMFPHHENEIAQTEARTGKKFSNYWMHNAYIMIDNEKMSKSKGNFFTVRDILKEYDGETIRFFLLSGQYRSPINFSRELMDAAKNGLERMRTARDNFRFLSENGKDGPLTEAEEEAAKKLDASKEKFIAVMDDDLNTADAEAAIFELIRDANTAMKDGATKSFAKKALDLLLELSDVLGLLEDKEDDAVDAELQALIDERQAARKAKNWARADEIRDLLKARGITLKDTPQGVQIVRE